MWTRVGVIAAVGFAIGILWPRFVGVRLGPNPPGQGSGPAVVESQAVSSAEAPPASAQPSAAPLPAPVHVQTVVVKPTDVLSCRNADGKVQESCDRPAFDHLLASPLRTLAKCPAAVGLSGKLSIGFEVDFGKSRVRVLHGKSTTIPASTVAGIWSCVRDVTKDIDVSGLTHEHARYTVFFNALFYPPGKVVLDEGLGAPPGGVPTTAASDQMDAKEPALGAAQVVYDTVLVRDAPKTGKVVARLVRGTRVQLVGREGSWYRIRFLEREGWIYRGAIAQ